MEISAGDVNWKLRRLLPVGVEDNDDDFSVRIHEGCCLEIVPAEGRCIHPHGALFDEATEVCQRVVIYVLSIGVAPVVCSDDGSASVTTVDINLQMQHL